jgi:hypothetical protein
MDYRAVEAIVIREQSARGTNRGLGYRLRLQLTYENAKSQL